eukprot:CAMPEP_0118905464 /NCGR_PEP_ID=MMETSP1166-20130328/9460_1 /TAXON_ID=1104430 /ORGANISM="Chrysoreinhardia sp, Strain CCMP3193" /LENGTH=585 /DNA_ID=CAMNT_0006844735 /DNA_START=182 /DNA_END=1939 /DNA_ORIENTATION=+
MMVKASTTLTRLQTPLSLSLTTKKKKKKKKASAEETYSQVVIDDNACDLREEIVRFRRGARNVATIRERLRNVAGRSEGLRDALLELACGRLEDAASWPRKPPAVAIALTRADERSTVGRVARAADGPYRELTSLAGVIEAKIGERELLMRNYVDKRRDLDRLSEKLEKTDNIHDLDFQVAVSGTEYVRAAEATFQASQKLKLALNAFEVALDAEETATTVAVAASRVAQAERAISCLKAEVSNSLQQYKALGVEDDDAAKKKQKSLLQVGKVLPETEALKDAVTVLSSKDPLSSTTTKKDKDDRDKQSLQEAMAAVPRPQSQRPLPQRKDKDKDLDRKKKKKPPAAVDTVDDVSTAPVAGPRAAGSHAETTGRSPGADDTTTSGGAHGQKKKNKHNANANANANSKQRRPMVPPAEAPASPRGEGKKKPPRASAALQQLLAQRAGAGPPRAAPPEPPEPPKPEDDDLGDVRNALGSMSPKSQRTLFARALSEGGESDDDLADLRGALGGIDSTEAKSLFNEALKTEMAKAGQPGGDDDQDDQDGIRQRPKPSALTPEEGGLDDDNDDNVWEDIDVDDDDEVAAS